MRLSCVLFCTALAAMAVPPDAKTPELPYRVVPEWPQLPMGMNFKETPGIAVDAREHVYVITRSDHPIREFDRDGKFIRSFGDAVYERPHAIRIDPEGNIWTVDDGAHVVLKMEAATGRIRTVLGRWKQSGETDKLFNRPTDIAWGPKGEIYVSDGYGNSRVVKFSKEGRFVTAWGKKGTGESEFDIPHSVAVDKQGLVYVGDRENYRIQVFDPDGKFIKQWKHAGSPWGLYITPDQSLYMSDGHNSRVLKLNLDGQILGAFGTFGKLPGEFHYVHHLSVGPRGDLYTAEILNWRPQKFVTK